MAVQVRGWKLQWVGGQTMLYAVFHRTARSRARGFEGSQGHPNLTDDGSSHEPDWRVDKLSCLLQMNEKKCGDVEEGCRRGFVEVSGDMQPSVGKCMWKYVKCMLTCKNVWKNACQHGAPVC